MDESAKLFLHWLVLCALISLFAVIFLVLTKFLVAIWKGKERGGVDWRDLVCTSDGKEIASKKCWSHVAAAVFTYIVIKDSLDPEGSDLKLVLAYMLIVGGFEVVMKVLAIWQGKPETKP